MLKAKLNAALLEAHVQASEHRITIEDKVHFLMAYERKKCSALLFFGAVFGFLGFAFAFLIGMYKFCNPYVSEFREVFPSGFGYFPSTVSEMVHNPQDPAGKCFFAFEFTSAFFIFMSWYPWELRNVYVGDSASIPFLNQLSWSMFRQFVPSAGMMLVATVTTTPFAQATSLDYVCIGIHLTGAVMLFAGYAVVEAFAIGWGCVKQSEVTAKTIGNMERKVRKFLLSGVVFWYTMFCALTGVLLLPLNEMGGHLDVWEPKTVTHLTGSKSKEIVLVDTASGWVLALKIASYASEVFCGLFLIASFMAIWYFCEERHSDLKDELCQVPNASPA
mmetsp:Transcript_53108/g.137172  ORF Transcript_53108/g.137172 Transcript_53108/m.137172 type:complete len:332 (+) Transcript_53108:102-1097(+)